MILVLSSWTRKKGLRGSEALNPLFCFAPALMCNQGGGEEPEGGVGISDGWTRTRDPID